MQTIKIVSIFQWEKRGKSVKYFMKFSLIAKKSRVFPISSPLFLQYKLFLSFLSHSFLGFIEATYLFNLQQWFIGELLPWILKWWIKSFTREHHFMLTLLSLISIFPLLNVMGYLEFLCVLFSMQTRAKSYNL